MSRTDGLAQDQRTIMSALTYIIQWLRLARLLLATLLLLLIHTN
jgi:hypothetical protein